jgi:uncharacterized protein
MQDISLILHDKISKLQEWFKPDEGSIIAFSGGIDSSLVLYFARMVQGRQNAIGVISNSESLKNKDFELAKSFCQKYDIQLEIITTKELEDERYSSNPSDRCFFCKQHLYADMGKVLEKYPGFKVLNGTNFDDLKDYRPGLKAASDHKIFSPLAECGITKDELRAIARYYDLINWDKPASPCLSSRIPYDSPITREKLQQVESAENILNMHGFEDVRVRHYGELARIEVKQHELDRLDKIRDKVIPKILALGFKKCEIDTEGLVSGKLNRVLSENKKQRANEKDPLL